MRGNRCDILGAFVPRFSRLSIVFVGLTVAPLSDEVRLVSRSRLSGDGSSWIGLISASGSGSDVSEQVVVSDACFSWRLCHLNSLRKFFFVGFAAAGLLSGRSRSLIARRGLEVLALCKVVEELVGVEVKVALLPILGD